jgi:hypothetical protein
MIDHIGKALDAETPMTEHDIVVTSEELNQLSRDSIKAVKAPDMEDTIDADREFVQEKLKDAIEQATGMLPGLVALAKVAESPNLYNSASKFLDSLAGLGTALIDIRIKTEKHKQSGMKGSGSPGVQGDDLDPDVPLIEHQAGDFEGTTEDLLDRIIERQNQKSIVIDQR